MKQIISFSFSFLLLTGCVSNERLPKSITILEKKLQDEKTRQSDSERKIMSLQIAIARQEIALIQEEISMMNESPSLLQEKEHFALEREKLVEIIQNNPSCASDAQNVLDQILALITRLSNETRS